VEAVKVVFLDTNIFEHSCKPRNKLRQRKGKVVYNGFEIEEVEYHEIHDCSEDYDDNMRDEIDLVSRIAKLALEGSIELVTHPEVDLERLSIKVTYGTIVNPFAGLTIRRLPDPILTKPPLLLSWADLPGDFQSRQMHFFDSIDNPRYLEIKSVCVSKKAKKKRLSQLSDAYHVFSAESHGADFFLTFDTRLINSFRNQKKVKLGITLLKAVPGVKISKNAVPGVKISRLSFNLPIKKVLRILPRPESRMPTPGTPRPSSVIPSTTPAPA
jgi:hypothetical protein